MPDGKTPAKRKKKTPEADLIRNMQKQLKARYGSRAYHIKNPGFTGRLPSGNWAGTRKGIPDLSVWVDSVPFLFEVKAPRGRVSAEQEAELQDGRSAMVTAEVVRSVDEMFNIIEETLAYNDGTVPWHLIPEGAS